VYEDWKNRWDALQTKNACVQQGDIFPIAEQVKQLEALQSEINGAAHQEKSCAAFQFILTESHYELFHYAVVRTGMPVVVWRQGKEKKHADLMTVVGDNNGEGLPKRMAQARQAASRAIVNNDDKTHIGNQIGWVWDNPHRELTALFQSYAE
jgi:hypothetical protein